MELPAVPVEVILEIHSLVIREVNDHTFTMTVDTDFTTLWEDSRIISLANESKLIQVTLWATFEFGGLFEPLCLVLSLASSLPSLANEEPASSAHARAHALTAMFCKRDCRNSGAKNISASFMLGKSFTYAKTNPIFPAFPA